MDDDWSSDATHLYADDPYATEHAYADDGHALYDPGTDVYPDDQDTISDVGESDSMKMQMTLDRTAKVYETLGNVIEKTSDASTAITPNLK